MSQVKYIPPYELHSTFYNDLFVLRTTTVINGQPAEIEFSGSSEITLKCRYPERHLSFSAASTQLEAILRKFSVCQVNGAWFDAATFMHVSIIIASTLYACISCLERYHTLYIIVQL